MHRTTLGAFLICFLLPLAAAKASAQDRRQCPVAEAGKIVVYGHNGSPIVLTESDLQRLPQMTVRETPRGGEPSEYAGPRLEDVLAPANLPRGRDLRGNEMTRYILVEAVDGYRALFALAELDSEFQAQVPILAVRQNGAALDSEAGPFQVIVPGEQRHARWVRQVACLRIARDPDSH